MKKLGKLLVGFFHFFMLVVFLFGFMSFNAVATDYASPEKKNDKVIPIAMATDNNYVDPALTAMVSICENKKSDIRLNFYTMVSGDVTEKNRKKIKNIQRMYRGCSVEIIDMKSKFSGAHVAGHFTTPMYYRLCLPSLLPNCDKVIYIDCDTITSCDLWPLYTTNIEKYYIGGVRAIGFHQQMKNKKAREDYIKRFEIKDVDQSINTGVLLINTKKMRQDNLEKKLLNYTLSLKRRKSSLPDQDTINVICYGKIKFLSPSYNAAQNYHELYEGPILPLYRNCCSEKEWKEIAKMPKIIHWAGKDKPWKTNEVPFFKEWDKYRKIYESKVKKLG